MDKQEIIDHPGGDPKNLKPPWKIIEGVWVYHDEMKKIPISVLDASSATMVLVALFFVNAHPQFWAAYALGCLVYVFINWKKQLYGQSVMNIVAAGLAIRNLVT